MKSQHVKLSKKFSHHLFLPKIDEPCRNTVQNYQEVGPFMNYRIRSLRRVLCIARARN